MSGRLVGTIARVTDLVRATDVFGITRDLPMNYVTRPSVDDVLVNALTRDQHLVIYGSSKQGKTSVRKYNLGDSDYVVITCSNKMSLGQLHAAILKAVGYNVVQSETRTTSGSFKIRAMAKISAKLLGHGGEVGAEAEAAGERSSEVVTHNLELDPDDPNDIIGALDSIQFDKYIVLEDFHYLSEETQKDFAVALKSFHESSQHDLRQHALASLVSRMAYRCIVTPDSNDRCSSRSRSIGML